MKKILIAIIGALAFLSSVQSCSSKEEPIPTPKTEPVVTPVEVESITLDKTEVVLDVYGASSVALKATVNPANASNISLDWSSSNNKVATVDGNGDLEDLNVQFSTLEGRPCATFVAPHFSPYGFYVNTGDLAIGTLDNTPKTGDPISPKWFISLGLAALSIFLFLKKDPKPRAKAA